MRNLSAVALSLALLALPAVSSAAQMPMVRVRGTIESVAGDAVTILTAAGEHKTVTLMPNTRIGADKQLALADIKSGDFIGTAATKEPNGHLKAIEVTVFPEELRGRGEGQRPWDAGPDSSMTNATVAEVMAMSGGQTLHLKYKDGEADVDVTPDTPVVTPIPGDKSLLVPGKAIAAFARINPDGSLSAAFVTVEKDGVKPPG